MLLNTYLTTEVHPQHPLSTGTNHESLKLTLKAAFDIWKQYPDSPQDGTVKALFQTMENWTLIYKFLNFSQKEQVHFIRVAGPGPDTS